MNATVPAPSPLAHVLASPDCFPVGLSADGRRVVWRDVGACRFTHAVFPWSLDAWAAEHELGAPFETELLALGNPNVVFESITPSLFVFHMSRCGSSLLGRSLAHGPRNVVMSEVPAINQALRRLCGGNLDQRISGPVKRRVVRNLIRLLGRRRRATDSRFLVKFTSWNVLQIESIRAAFPEVPCLFLYRDPAEVVVSLVTGPPGWVQAREQDKDSACSLSGSTRAELEGMGDAEYVVRCLGRMMRAGLDAPGVRYLDYADLRADALPRLLGAFDIECGAEELAAMAEPFAVDSKAVDGTTPFAPDSEHKQASVDDSLRALVARDLDGLHEALATSARNLRGVLRGVDGAG